MTKDLTKEETTQLTFRLKWAMREKLKEIANAKEMSESDIIREAIREKISSFFCIKRSTNIGKK